jgi:hypothetical protein
MPRKYLAPKNTKVGHPKNRAALAGRERAMSYNRAADIQEGQ